MLDIVLASASERRKELMSKITTDFKILVSDFDESTIVFQGEVEGYVMELSKQKALAVAAEVKNPSVIIGCDTIVTFDNLVLGKPNDGKDAFRMLKSLRGRSHKVYTGVTLYDTEKKLLRSDFSCTEVVFSNITDEQIKKYVSTGEPFDKAGAYGIQGLAGVFVEGITGCYYNVVGLPLNKLYSMLGEMGIDL